MLSTVDIAGIIQNRNRNRHRERPFLESESALRLEGTQLGRDYYDEQCLDGTLHYWLACYTQIYEEYSEENEWFASFSLPFVSFLLAFCAMPGHKDAAWWVEYRARKNPTGRRGAKPNVAIDAEVVAGAPSRRAVHMRRHREV